MVNLNQAGYLGQSMSVRAKNAYDNGEKPFSKWKKDEIISEMEQLGFEPKTIQKAETFNAVQLRFIALKYSSYHHTGKFARKTNFFRVNDDEIEIKWLLGILTDKEHSYIVERNAFIKWAKLRNSSHKKVLLRKDNVYGILAYPEGEEDNWCLFRTQYYEQIVEEYNAGLC